MSEWMEANLLAVVLFPLADGPSIATLTNGLGLTVCSDMLASRIAGLKQIFFPLA